MKPRKGADDNTGVTGLDPAISMSAGTHESLMKIPRKVQLKWWVKEILNGKTERVNHPQRKNTNSALRASILGEPWRSLSSCGTSAHSGGSALAFGALFCSSQLFVVPNASRPDMTSYL